jgi:hypothetical protein
VGLSDIKLKPGALILGLGLLGGIAIAELSDQFQVVAPGVSHADVLRNWYGHPVGTKVSVIYSDSWAYTTYRWTGNAWEEIANGFAPAGNYGGGGDGGGGGANQGGGAGTPGGSGGAIWTCGQASHPTAGASTECQWVTP